MPNRLPIPNHLQHLIEKRESDTRRTTPRRASDATSAADSGASSDQTASLSKADQNVAKEPQALSPRKSIDRRANKRRKTD